MPDALDWIHRTEMSSLAVSLFLGRRGSVRQRVKRAICSHDWSGHAAVDRAIFFNPIPDFFTIVSGAKAIRDEQADWDARVTHES